MKYLISLIIILTCSIVLGQSNILQAEGWQKISADNVSELIMALEVQLPPYITDYTIKAIYLIPNHPISFIHIHNELTSKDQWILWDMITYQSILESDQSELDKVIFSTNGNFMAITSRSPENRRLSDTCLWTIVSLEKLTCWSTRPYPDLLFTPDESLLILPSPDGIVIGWDINQNQQRFTIPVYSLSMAISPDGSTLAFDSNDTFTIWDITTNNPTEYKRHQLSNLLSVEGVSFDKSGRYVFFTTITLTRPQAIEFGIWDIQENLVSYIKRENFPKDFFDNDYGRLFLFLQANSRFNTDIIDVITGENYGVINVATIRDYTLEQDVFIGLEEVNNILLWTVKNFETQESLFVLSDNIDNSLVDVQFTQDERFILAYTEDGLVQLWGVPVDS